MSIAPVHSTSSESIIEYCVNLQNQIQIYRNDSNSNEINSSQKSALTAWGNEFKDITQEFFRIGMTSIPIAQLEQGNVPEWAINEWKEWNRAPNEPGKKNYYARLPYLSSKTDKDTSKLRLKWLLDLLLTTETTTDLFDLLNELKFFEYLSKHETYKTALGYKNTNHLSDYTSDEELQQRVLKIFKPGDNETKFKSDRFILDMTKIMLFLNLISTGSENILDSWKIISENLRYKLSSNIHVKHAERIRDRIQLLDWGPEYYSRNDQYLVDVMHDLDANGVVALTGFGGVGKTAMATNIIKRSVDDKIYQRYVTSSLKINSNQKEFVSKKINKDGRVETSDLNSIFDPLRHQTGTIQGSIRRLCRQIINAAGHKERSNLEDADDELFMTYALESLEHTTILVCVDNYEDIENPEAEYIQDEAIYKSISEQYDMFEEFFKRWGKRYRELNHDNENKTIYSKIIITTRGKAPNYHSHEVAYLDEQENFDLFKNKILHRVRSDEDCGFNESIIQAIDQDWNLEIKDMFNEYKLVKTIENDTVEIEGFHPLNTIAAAVEIDNNILNDVLNSISEWDPKGRNAKDIHKYTTSKLLKGYTELQKKILIYLGTKTKNKPFTLEELIEVADTEDFGYVEADTFIKYFTVTVNWFVRSNSPGNARFYWRNEMYLAVTASEEFTENKSKYEFEQDEAVEDNIEDKVEPKYSDSERKEVIKSYLSWLSKDKQFKLFSDSENGKICINTAKEFTELLPKLALIKKYTDEELILMCYSIFNTDIGNQRNVFKQHKIENSLLNVFKNVYQIRSVRPQSEQKQRKYNIKPTTNSFNKFHSDKMESVNQLTLEITKILLKRIQDADSKLITLKHIVYIMKCLFNEEIITLKSLTSYYELFLDTASDLFDNGDIHDFELLGQITQDYLNQMCDILNIVPDNLRWSWRKEPNIIEYLTLVINSFESMFSHSSGGIEELTGKIYWASMHLAMNGRSNDSTKFYLQEYFNEGYELVKNRLNKLVVLKWRNDELKINKQPVWDFRKLISKEFQRFGVLKKLVLLSEDILNYPVTIELVPPKDDDNQVVELSTYKNKYVYIVENFTESTYYLMPLMNKDGSPVELTEQIDMSKLIDELSNSILELKSKDKIYRWNEFLNRIMEKSEIDVNPFFNSLINNQLQNDVAAAQYLLKHLEDEKLKFDYKEIQRVVYIKFGKFNHDDESKLTKFDYENRFVHNETYLQITGSARKMKGYSLPRNPGHLASILNEFDYFRKSPGTIMKYREFKQQVIKNRIGVKDNDILYRCTLYLYRLPNRGKSVRDPKWMDREIDRVQFEEFDILGLMNRIKELVVWEGTTRRVNDGLKPFNKNLINVYFEDVKKKLIIR